MKLITHAWFRRIATDWGFKVKPCHALNKRHTVGSYEPAQWFECIECGMRDFNSESDYKEIHNDLEYELKGK